MKLAICFVAITALLAGCASLEADGLKMANELRADVSSGLIGCAPADIQVSDHLSNSWKATCKGRVFYCSGTPTACSPSL